MLTDTDPKAEAAYMAALRRMSPATRLQTAVHWSRTVRDLKLAAIRRQHAEADEKHLHRLLADVLLGKSLASRAYREHAEHG